ncbi:MAG TPA: hypothetical protein DEQ02_08675 [Ruminococcaceae bacterium]|nr:hypothetical protein [Oscillospiraceae bacterium]
MYDNHFHIGITGHRRLPEEKIPVITWSVKDFYADIKKLNESKITVLSSLAEGADMLCAKLALDMGFRLAVPLPMNVAEYRKDFSAYVAGEFDHLLSMADEVFVVTPEEPVPYNPSRGFYYRQAGIYVAKKCDFLLAVWDGVENDTPDGAGTWETIKLARKFGRTVSRFW